MRWIEAEPCHVAYLVHPRISPGEHTGVGRRRNGHLAYGALKQSPFFSKLVHIGRLDPAIPIAAQMVSAQRINRHNNDIQRTPLRSRLWLRLLLFSAVVTAGEYPDQEYRHKLGSFHISLQNRVRPRLLTRSVGGSGDAEIPLRIFLGYRHPVSGFPDKDSTALDNARSSFWNSLIAQRHRHQPREGKG